MDGIQEREGRKGYKERDKQILSDRGGHIGETKKGEPLGGQTRGMDGHAGKRIGKKGGMDNGGGGRRETNTDDGNQGQGAVFSYSIVC